MGLADPPGLPEIADSDGRESDVGDPDVGEPDVGLALDGGSMLPDSADVELGGVSLDAGEGPLLGASDDGADWLGVLDNAGLGSDEAIGLPESPELSDCGEADFWLPLDGPPSLDVWLADCWDVELAGGLDPVESSLLFVIDDISEALSWLTELATDDCDSFEVPLGEVTELPEWATLL